MWEKEGKSREKEWWCKLLPSFEAASFCSYLFLPILLKMVALARGGQDRHPELPSEVLGGAVPKRMVWGPNHLWVCRVNEQWAQREGRPTPLPVWNPTWATIHLLEWLNRKYSPHQCRRECGATVGPLHCWWECAMGQPLWKFLPRDPATLYSWEFTLEKLKLLFPEKGRTWMFIAALFIITKHNLNILQWENEETCFGLSRPWNTTQR